MPAESSADAVHTAGLTALPPRTLRMRDLTREAQLSRQAIHFYIAEGLLPPPVSTGRNVAAYSTEHLERLQWIQKLQREHFLSLNAIRAVLNGETAEGFSPEQQQLLRRVRDQMPGWARPGGRGATPLAELTSVQAVSAEELTALAQAGLIRIEGEGAQARVSQDDADIVDCYVRYREVGATGERGYRPEHLAVMNAAVEGLVERLARIYADRWATAPAADAVAFMEAVIPIDERLMGVLLRKKFHELIDRAAHADIQR
jgi:DNA-binding transcriptional MerR regulator